MMRDFEFGFANGQVTFVSVEVGRDDVKYMEAAIQIIRFPDKDAREDVTVNRQHLSYLRVIERLEQPEPKDPVEAALAGVPV